MVPRHISNPWGWPLGPYDPKTTIITIEGQPILARDASLGMVLLEYEIQAGALLHRRNTYAPSVHIPTSIANEENR